MIFFLSQDLSLYFCKNERKSEQMEVFFKKETALNERKQRCDKDLALLINAAFISGGALGYKHFTTHLYVQTKYLLSF